MSWREAERPDGALLGSARCTRSIHTYTDTGAPGGQTRDDHADVDDGRWPRRVAALARWAAVVLRLGRAGDHRVHARWRERGRRQRGVVPVLDRLAARWSHARRRRERPAAPARRRRRTA